MSKKGSTSVVHDFAVGDVVLGKIKGYPNWPAQVLEDSAAPPKVASERPKQGKHLKLVQFFPVGDYAWLNPREILPLSAETIEKYLTSHSANGKQAGLYQGYQIAGNPKEWNDEREADYAEEEEEEAVDSNQDQLDEEEAAADDDEDDKPKSKKRKTPETSKKQIQEDKKAKKAKVEKPAKGKTSSGSKKEKSEESFAEPAPKKSKPSASDSPVESEGLKKCKTWRKELQKVFLNKVPPKAEDLPKCVEYFDTMENFEFEREWLIETKLPKVFKKLKDLADGTIPNESEYKFRERAARLAQKLPGAESTAANGNDSPAAATNGQASTESTANEPTASDSNQEAKVESTENSIKVDEKPETNGENEQEKPKTESESAAPVEA